MPAFRFFDPWAMLDNSMLPGTAAKPAKPANPAKGDTQPPSALVPSALMPDRTEASRVFGKGAVPTPTLPKRRPMIGDNSAKQCVRPANFPDEAVLLRDGRRLWRFKHGRHCATDRAADLLDRAYWFGTVLVADGCELIVVEPWLSNLPAETLRNLRRYSVGVIAALRQRPTPTSNFRRSTAVNNHRRI